MTYTLANITTEGYYLHTTPDLAYLLPLQALWVDWEPSNRQADPDSWRLWKLDSAIDPGDVLFNGSRSLHAVGDRGFHVDSRDGHERLSIRWASQFGRSILQQKNTAILSAVCCWRQHVGA
jgi:hypothetical protein